AIHLLEVVDRHRRRRISADHEVDVAYRDVTRADSAARFRRENLLADRLPAHASRPSLRATHAAPIRFPIVFTAERHMSSGRSTAVTSAMPAAARGPSPIALSTICVVMSELPGTPAPANAATVDMSTMVSIMPPPTGTPYRCARNTAR